MAKSKTDDIFRQYPKINVLYVDSAGRVFFSPSARANLTPVYRKKKKIVKPKPKE